LDADVEEIMRVEAQNILYVRDPDGSWQPSLDDNGRPGSERGLVWQVWPTAVRGRPFRAFEGVCAIDGELAPALLEGLHPRDEEGRPLLSLACGLRFLLDDEEAKLFVERVAALDGVVQRRRLLTSAQAQDALLRLRGLLAGLLAERELDERCLREAEQGIFVTTADFEQRSERFRAACIQAAELVRGLRRELRQLLSQGRTREERAEARSLLDEAETLAEQVRLHYEDRDGTACGLALLEARASGRSLPQGPSLARTVAFREVARAARESGILVSEEDGVIRLALGEDSALELGSDSIRYLPTSDN
jgi:hypothetical protein